MKWLKSISKQLFITFKHSTSKNRLSGFAESKTKKSDGNFNSIWFCGVCFKNILKIFMKMFHNIMFYEIFLYYFILSLQLNRKSQMHIYPKYIPILEIYHVIISETKTVALRVKILLTMGQSNSSQNEQLLGNKGS